ncbi:MAG: hypothetical protein R3F28_11555 [Candidatus Kapaibacterium sp.]
MAHHALAVVPSRNAQEGEILGLAWQKLWNRPERARAKESRSERLARPRQSQVWEQTLEGIGEAPAHSMWVSVGDRESDIYNYMQRSRELGWHFLLRVAHNRRIETSEGLQSYLKSYLRKQPPVLSRRIHLRASTRRVAQDVELQISHAVVWITASALCGQQALGAQKCWSLRCVGTTREEKSLSGSY